jgi:hypothetical protein
LRFDPVVLRECPGIDHGFYHPVVLRRDPGVLTSASCVLTSDPVG